ncbi:MAG: hypothetical protein ACK4N5_19775 [Myxococcales bacterium]
MRHIFAERDVRGLRWDGETARLVAGEQREAVVENDCVGAERWRVVGHNPWFITFERPDGEQESITVEHDRRGAPDFLPNPR